MEVQELISFVTKASLRSNFFEIRCPGEVKREGSMFITYTSIYEKKIQKYLSWRSTEISNLEIARYEQCVSSISYEL